MGWLVVVLLHHYLSLTTYLPHLATPHCTPATLTLHTPHTHHTTPALRTHTAPAHTPAPPHTHTPRTHTPHLLYTHTRAAHLTHTEPRGALRIETRRDIHVQRSRSRIKLLITRVSLLTRHNVTVNILAATANRAIFRAAAAVNINARAARLYNHLPISSTNIM